MVLYWLHRNRGNGALLTSQEPWEWCSIGFTGAVGMVLSWLHVWALEKGAQLASFKHIGKGHQLASLSTTECSYHSEGSLILVFIFFTNAVCGHVLFLNIHGAHRVGQTDLVAAQPVRCSRTHLPPKHGTCIGPRVKLGVRDHFWHNEKTISELNCVAMAAQPFLDCSGFLTSDE